MTTRALVPNADGEGSLGIEGLNWGAMYVSSPEKDDNSQKVPSTAWVRQIIAEEIQKASLFTLERIFPVGSIYTSLTDSRNPSEILGFGTWEPLPAGYTLIAQGQGADQFGSFEYVAGQKYGERMPQLTTDELPHIHGDVLDFARQDPAQKLTTHGVFSAPASVETVAFGSNKQSGQGDGFVMDFGKDVPHNNIPPSVCAYCWKRTA